MSSNINSEINNTNSILNNRTPIINNTNIEINDSEKINNNRQEINNNKLSDQPINVIENQINNLPNEENIDNETTKSNEEIKKEIEEKQEKYLGLNVRQWGIVSAIANFASVVSQLYKTIKTEKVKSFSMKFISLMTFLNLVYVIIGILTENHGMTFACLVFVIYNLIIVYYYYFGK